MQTQEDHSNPIPALNVDSLKVDLVVIQNTCSEKEDSNSETASSKLVKECSLNSETKDVHAIKYKMSKAKERCMAYFRSLHSHLQVLSKGDLKGTRIEHGFKRAFMSLFGKDADTFTSTMLLNFSLDYDSQMTDKYFVEYTGIEVKHFRDTLLQHMGNVKKYVAERTLHQRQYDRGVNKRQLQTQESKIDTGKALDVDLVDTESIRTDSTVQDDNSRSGNDTDTDDADIRPIYDKEPMVEVQLTAEYNIFAIGQQHTEQPEIIVEGRVDQYPKTCQVKSPMLDSSPDNRTTEYSKQSLKSKNILLTKRQLPISKDFSRNEAHLWKPTGRIFKSVGLRWIPTGKLFDSCTSKVDSELTHGLNVDILNIHECKQTLDPRTTMSTKVPTADMIELESLFGHLFDEYLNGENQVLSKSSAVTTVDASDKHQQLDSTSSTSTPAITITADGNFDL
ncbi:hypothetical protein Tco_0572686 [Tanacetum coccineum]